MKISPISGITAANSIKSADKISNPVKYKKIDNSKYPLVQMLQFSYGKESIPSFKSRDFKQTLALNFYHLPEGCNPDGFQIEAGEEINKGKDVLVEAPTGTGKTAIAYYAVSKNMDEGKKTFYTAPLKALSNQKLNEMKKVFGEENIGILTGDRRENVDAPVIVMTTEVYRNMAVDNELIKPNPLMENLGTVIFDEFHYLGDASRGKVWEESLMFTPQDVQTLSLSATVGNPKNIQDWIESLKTKEKSASLISVPEEARHVPLQFDTLETASFKIQEKKMKKQIKKAGYVEESDSDIVVKKPLLSDYNDAVEKLNKKEQLPAIFFVFSKRFSRELLNYFSIEGQDLTTREEKQEIQKILKKYRKNDYIGSDLNTAALIKGYAIHNAGIIPAQKQLIEELFQKKLIKTVIATETLAAGINMPARTVVISSPFKPVGEEEDKNCERPLTANEFKQMSGRAGRRGIDEIGYVYTMPTNRMTEMEFLLLEYMESNKLKSRYSPDYSFLTGYFDAKHSEEGLREIFSRTFNAYSPDEEKSQEKVDELMEVAANKTKVLQERGFLEQYGDKTEVTTLGRLASKVKGYDAITLSELIAEKHFEGITPETLAMIAAGLANPADGREDDILADLSDIFEESVVNIDKMEVGIESSLNKNLSKFGKSLDDFATYQEVLEFIQGIKKPHVNFEALTEDLKAAKYKLNIIHQITRGDGNYTLNGLVEAMKCGDVIPSDVLEKYSGIVDDYKRRVNVKNIDSHIERLSYELEQQNVSAKGNKAKAKIYRRVQELQGEIKQAQIMKFLDENLMDFMGDNHEFLKKNPEQKVKEDFHNIEGMFNRLILKDVMLNQINGLMQIDEYQYEHNNNYDKDRNYEKAKGCFNEIIKKTGEIYVQELEHSVERTPYRYGSVAPKALYNWVYFNKINSDTMTNWKSLLKVVPENDADEGSLYRIMLQTADLLSQIGEIAEVGLENAVEEADRRYYIKLKNTALEARELIIKEPVKV